MLNRPPLIQLQLRIFSFAAAAFLGMVVAATTAFANPPATALQADAIRSQQLQIKAGQIRAEREVVRNQIDSRGLDRVSGG